MGSILTRHSELRCATGEVQPSSTAGGLAGEIHALRAQAVQGANDLRAAIAQQEAYDAEVRELTTLVVSAHDQLRTSPVTADSVETFRRQIAEHNVRCVYVVCCV